MKPKHSKCPHCGSPGAVRIVYGYPTEETMRLAEEGFVLLGGCCQLIEDPDRACTVCRYRWNSKTGIGSVHPDNLAL